MYNVIYLFFLNGWYTYPIHKQPCHRSDAFWDWLSRKPGYQAGSGSSQSRASTRPGTQAAAEFIASASAPMAYTGNPIAKW
jgi:hypothetical protein